jgi:DNA-binding transcriptional MerR regulator
MKRIMVTQRIGADLRLTIDQMSQLTGVRKSTLRYWEKSFQEFLQPNRTPSNRREYPFDTLERVRAIKRLLEQEHLTGRGVRLRLLELFPCSPEGDGQPNLTPATQKERILRRLHLGDEPGPPPGG